MPFGVQSILRMVFYITTWWSKVCSWYQAHQATTWKTTPEWWLGFNILLVNWLTLAFYHIHRLLFKSTRPTPSDFSWVTLSCERLHKEVSKPSKPWLRLNSLQRRWKQGGRLLLILICAMPLRLAFDRYMCTYILCASLFLLFFWCPLTWLMSYKWTLSLSLFKQELKCMLHVYEHISRWRCPLYVYNSRLYLFYERSCA